MTGWTAAEGSPFPQGLSWIEEEQAYNFALYSKHAERVTLLFYGEDDVVSPIFTYQFNYLKNKSGRIWHCKIPETMMKDVRHYAYAVTGPEPNYAYAVTGPEPKSRFEWHCFDPEKILLDPYARAIFFPPTFDRRAALRPGSNAGKAPLGVIYKDEPALDWSGDRCPRHESDGIIYELHIKGFTNNPNSGVSQEKRGTYAGLIEKIPYLKELGVTIVELMPVFQFDPQEGNYWGYMPVNFFAPHQGYASTKAPHEQRNEFRAMVKALHQADIEVILDVVYNHTAEGNHTGPVYTVSKELTTAPIT